MGNDAGESAVKDSFDEVLRRTVTGDATPELKPGAVLSERFTIDRMVGAGGMGAVYVARDQTLGRDVAIKLHHTPGGALRLRREAMAMARLAHPNVVTVFEVGELGRFPFVVMEYVPGTTLREWLAAVPRTVTEIVDMMLAAGAGLAAAHDAGLIHRDIKPENVLVGNDGRARVGDFGLARELDSQEDQPPPGGSTPNLLAPMTQTGAVLGTPAYMAPEQIGGVMIDPRADQFAFCVTTWEALWGQRPYAGSNVEEVMRAVTGGVRREPPATPKVPSRIRLALERGLAVDPEGRYPTMRQLLEALAEPLRRRRKRFVIGAAALGLAAFGTVGYLAIGRGAKEMSCDDAGAAEIALLPTEIVTRMQALGDADASKRVGEALASFAVDLRKVSVSACDATRTHEWSPQLYAKSRVCLVTAARSVQNLLRPARLVREDLHALVHRSLYAFPGIEECGSASFLAASPDLPTDPSELDGIVEARSDLKIALTELQDRRAAEARPYIDRVERSAMRESRLIKPALLVVHGVAAVLRGDYAAAEKLASDGYYAARSFDDDVQLATALQVLLGLADQKHPDDPRVSMWLRTAIADAERIAKRAPWLAASLYNSSAAVAVELDDAAGALRYVARARELAPASLSIRHSGEVIEANILLWSSKVDEGIAAYERIVAEEAARIGADHPDVAALTADYAVSLLEAGRYEPALVQARRAMAILEKIGDENDQSSDNARVNLAAALLGTDNDAEAKVLFETARRHYVLHQGERSTAVAHIDMNLAVVAMDAHEPARAITLLESALATYEVVIGPDRPDTADVLYNLAAARRDANDLAGAQAAAQRAADIYTKVRPGVERHVLALSMVASMANRRGDPATALARTDDVMHLPTPPDQQAYAWTEVERARALIAVNRPAEARPLLVDARDRYGKVPLPGRVKEIDDLLAQMR